MDEPEIQYARMGDLYIAYQVFGSGPVDLLYVPTWVNNLDHSWDDPDLSRFFRRIASSARVIMFDLPGFGMSDPVAVGSVQRLEEWVQATRVVMDAARCQKATLLGWNLGGMIACLFAASLPGRTAGLVLVDSEARVMRAPDYPIGLPESLRETAKDSIRRIFMGDDTLARWMVPSRANDQEFLKRLVRFWRSSTGPGAAEAIFDAVLDLDVRHVLPAIRVPTLVIHQTGDKWITIPSGRYLAENIPGARLVELEGDDHYMWGGANEENISREIQSFIASERRDVEEIDRVLATILFTDIVDSTGRLAKLGDHRWREVLDAHDRLARESLARYRGRLVDTTGDGFMATFDGAARAIRCAKTLSDDMTQLGVEIRAGLHTGEIELRGENIGGIAVHAAARVMAQASAGEVMVSSTVKDLVAGSGLEFDDRGLHTLKGVPGEWRLFSLSGAN